MSRLQIVENTYVSRSGFKSGRIILTDSFGNRIDESKMVTIDLDNAPANFPNEGELNWLMQQIVSNPAQVSYEFPIGVKIDLLPYGNLKSGVWVLADYINYLLRSKG